MCGIVGYVGKKKDCEFVIKKLKCLEYRGYDSSGVAYLENNDVEIVKEVGKISNLEEKIIKDKQVSCAIAHTRWATHGKPSILNSHPHTSKNNIWTIVHNGIIENYKELKENLKTPSESETDTAVVAELLEEQNAETIGEFIETMNNLVGSFAIVAINKNKQNELFLAKNKSPLYVAECDGDFLVASDPICFVGFSKDYYSFENFEYAHIFENNIEFFDKQSKKISKTKLELDDSFEQVENEKYEHFMLKEIMEQPDALNRQLKTYKDTNILAKFDKDFILKFDFVEFIGCGTAYHAAMIGAKYVKKMLGIRADAEIASEFIYNEPVFANEKTLFIFVSQSGETADTLLALNLAKAKGATCLALTNVLYSTIAKNADIVLPVCAGPEIAVASTKAYVCQLSALYMFISHLKNQIDGTNIKYFDDIEKVSKNILKFDKKYIENIADEIKDEQNPIFIGKDLDYISACEASLKLKEVAYVNATNYPSGELKHGFLALVEDKTPIIVFASQQKTNSKTLNAASEAMSRGANQITITNDKDFAGNTKIFLDEENEFLMPILSIVPLQYLAYEVSVKKGINPDKPRNLAKSVTVE